jgi:uncharacterized delta-60 repeat protein
LSLEPLEDRRLLSAGAPDPTFGANGIVTTAFPNNTSDGALSVAIYPNAGTSNDGKIVAAGYSRSPTNTLLQDFALARYNRDGSPDTSFDGDGKVVTDVSGIGKEDAAFAVAIQADGKIVAAGFARRRSGDTDFAVVRYNVNGSLDPTFGTKGIVLTDFNRGDDDAFSLLIQPDGKILVAGLGGSGLYMARYNTNGSLDDGSKKDTTPGDHFGTGGEVVFSFSSVPGSTGDGGTPSLVGLAPDGKILLSGTALTGSTTQILVLLRYNADGTPDRSFGSAGMVVDTSMPGGLLRVRSDGELVVEGVGPSNDWLFARYQANGSLDTPFGTNGYADITHPPDASAGNYFALQSDGKIVTPGVLPGGMLALRLNADGSVDSTFGSKASRSRR